MFADAPDNAIGQGSSALLPLGPCLPQGIEFLVLMEEMALSPQI